ncbi:hypothetical protein [Nocardioides sp. 503]|uniref:hypothetical protein n=1 Tax=Nocardioides sp. 503 TaxID=2508326 RepID=UPI00106FAD2F|nr:hypothetical protein [Nocardioides sp. 503]
MPSPRRLLGALALVALTGALVTACGDPNAGDAARSELEAFLDDRPVEGYRAETVHAENTLPFSGSLDVVVAAVEPEALSPDGYESAMRDVAEQVCEFSPEADVSVEWAFGLGDYSTPLPCPGDGPEERLADAAALLVEASEVPGVESIHYGFSGTLDVVAPAGADLVRVRTVVEGVARRHTVALDDEDPYVSVSGRPGESAPGSTPRSASPTLTPAG